MVCVRDLSTTLSPSKAERGIQVTSGIPSGSTNFLYSDTISSNTFLGEVHQVHLIDRQHHVLDAQQRYQESMTTGLGNHTRTGVYQR